MGVSVRMKDGNWYVFIRHSGQRAAQKCLDEDHARKTQEAVITAIASRQFDLAGFRKKDESQNQQETSATLTEFFEKTMDPLWRASLAAGTFAVYEGSFRTHIKPVLGETRIDEITRDKVKK